MLTLATTKKFQISDICYSNIEHQDWLERGTKGFPTLGGSEGVTQGVLLWSKPLTILLNGQTVAVLLMDTQVVGYLGAHI